MDSDKASGVSGLLFSKLKASGLHVFLCAGLLALTVLPQIVWLYPGVYFELAGVWPIVKIILLVDLVLGPALTFVVYKSHKPGLRRDLSVIAAVQLLALGYGNYVLYTERPAYFVFAVDRFEVVNTSEIDWSKVRPEFIRPQLTLRPLVVYAKMPDDRSLRESLMFEAVAGGRDLERHPEYYERIEPFREAVLQKAIRRDGENFVFNGVGKTGWQPVVVDAESLQPLRIYREP